MQSLFLLQNDWKMLVSNRNFWKFRHLVLQQGRKIKNPKPVLNDKELQGLRSKLKVQTEKFEKDTIKEQLTEVSETLKTVKENLDGGTEAQANRYFFQSYLKNWPIKSPEIPQISSVWNNWNIKKPSAISINVNQKSPPKIVHLKKQVKAKSQYQLQKITASLLNNLDCNVSTDPNYVKRLEELCLHLYKHPETKGQAIRQQAVGLILR